MKGPSAKEYEDAVLISVITALQDEHHDSLGYRKMTDRLESDYGIHLSRGKVLRLMDEADRLSCVRRRHFSEEYYITRRRMKDDLPPDLIGRDFHSSIPRTKLVCDITYLTGSDETWYLNSIEDLFNGEILGWLIGEHCTSALCAETVMAMENTGKTPEGCILHSDGGSTYVSYTYRELLLGYGIRQSMGRRRSCFDNARIESFNGVLKTECLYSFFGKNKVRERRVPVKELAEQVERFIPYYNERRMKDSLGHMSPVEFRLSNPRGTLPAVGGAGLLDNGTGVPR